MADANTLRRLNWLWKYRHRHDDDNFQEQIDVIRTTIEQQADDVAGSSFGTYLHAIADSQPITSGGTAIEWANTYGQIPSSGPTEVAYPSTDVRVGMRGYYNVDVSLAWDTYEGGGTVSVVRVRGGLETTVWPPSEVTDWTSTDAKVFWGQAPAIPCEPGDFIRVYLDADSTETLAGAVCAVYLVDREEDTGGGCVDILGGTATQPGDGYIYHWFGSSDTLTVNQGGVIEYVIVGGGGGGGGAYGDGGGGSSEEGPGGGGGGGEVVTGSITLAPGDYTVTVGAGGAGGAEEGAGAGDAAAGDNGEDSVLETVGTAVGGGGGGSVNEAAKSGGSGGGGSFDSDPGENLGAAASGSGGDGGDGDTGSPFHAGGGGGAGQDGSDASAGSHGGDGVEVTAFDQFGESGWFGGGGGGGRWGAGGDRGDGGQGGGGGGNAFGQDGDANTGGGGAGAANQSFGLGNSGGDGGSGVVIVRYPEC